MGFDRLPAFVWRAVLCRIRHTVLNSKGGAEWRRNFANRASISCTPKTGRRKRDEIDDGWIVEIQSPEPGFLLVSLHTDRPLCAELLEQTLDDLRADYPDLEAETAVGKIAGQDATGYDVRFFSLDFTNLCVMRSFMCQAGTVMVLWQVTDVDEERLEPVMRAIVASLRVDERE